MITCYLDTQDYSVLTDPKQDNPENRGIRQALLSLSKSKQVRFAFSEVVVCELVPISEDATYLAELKANFLSELCGANALISKDRLERAEVLALAKGLLPVDSMLDPQGRWFPELPVSIVPDLPQHTADQLLDHTSTFGALNRKQRRAYEKRAAKNRANPQHPSSVPSNNSLAAVVEELLQKFAMKAEYVGLMARYVRRQATKLDFLEGLNSSLSDPRWVMQWLSKDYSLASPLSDFVREPGRSLGNLARSMATIGSVANSRFSELEFSNDMNPAPRDFAEYWTQLSSRQLVRAVQNVAAVHRIDLTCSKLEEIEIFCPGITAGLRSLSSSVWPNVAGGQKKLPIDSQPIDAWHAFYAPYVDVFRADKFMAPHIQRHVKNSGTTVVPKLGQLVHVLESKIARRP